MNANYKIENAKGFFIIEVLVEKFDFFEISESAAYLRDLIQERDYISAIFDLTRVSYIDSSVFGLILEISRTLKPKGNEIVIICTNTDVLRVMALLKVSTILPVFYTRAEAVDYLNRKLNL
jgi:anti-anti-sigma factor